MTQEIVYRCPDGIVLASDSLVVHIGEDGQRAYSVARKLFPLGSWAALVTAGAFIGVRISQDFAALAAAAGWRCMEQLVPAAQSFFEWRYGGFIREHEAYFTAHPDAYRSLYVLLAGRSNHGGVPAWEVLLLSSEAHRLPFQAQAIVEVLTVPRRLGLEGRLLQRLKCESPLEAVANYCHGALNTLAARDPGQVGQPFYTAILDGQGFRWWSCPDEAAQ